MKYEGYLIGIIVLLLTLVIIFALAIKTMDMKDKFCPECGRRYHDAVYCEYDGTELKEIQK